MMPVVVACPSCGSKVNIERTTCPRCRAPLVVDGPEVQATAAPLRDRRAVLAAAGVLGFAVVIAGAAWTRTDSAPPPGPSASALPADAADGAAEGSSTALAGRTGAAPTRPDYFEASSEGAVAYGTGDYAEAAERYQAAILKNPDDAESLSNLGQVLVRQGKVEEALPYFDRAIAIIPQRWSYHFNRARALGLVGRTAEAVKGYQAAQQLFPNDYATAFNLGLALHRLGDEAAAVDAFKSAIALDPDDATFHLALGTSLERLHRSAEAAAAYTEYLRLAPAALDADKVRARITQLTPSSPAS